MRLSHLVELSAWVDPAGAGIEDVELASHLSVCEAVNGNGRRDSQSSINKEYEGREITEEVLI